MLNPVDRPIAQGYARSRPKANEAAVKGYGHEWGYAAPRLVAIDPVLSFAPPEERRALRSHIPSQRRRLDELIRAQRFRYTYREFARPEWCATVRPSVCDGNACPIRRRQQL